MKKLSTLCLVAILTLLLQSNSFACSVNINQDSTKTSMIQAIANYYNISSASISKDNLSKANFSFLAGLGADCSGLEQAIITSAFDFSITKLLKTCRYRGVIIHKESAPANEYFFNAEAPVCTSVIIPVHPILPINRN